MKRIKIFLSLAFAALSLTANAQQSITIQGKVKFTDEGFKVQVYQRDGQDKKVLAEVPVNADNTYKVTVPVEKPGVAVVDCGRWQSVQVWLEDEDMGIDFRGLDTARIKVKNPPYVYIRAGKKNEVMNLMNFYAYRNYQAMIAASQNVYRAKIEDEKKSHDLASSFYDFLGDDNTAWMRYLVEHYADRTSVLAPLSRLNDEKNADVIEPALKQLETQSEVARQLVADYRTAKADAKEKRERMQDGKPAPDFAFQTDKGKATSLDKYKGKVLVLDFWASWCGPCRQEVPNLKKYYEEFKDKGVEFLSVSIDAKKDAWTKALKEEAMPWKQGWTPDSGKEAMNTYQFSGIPFILLIDKDGNIYRKHLRGEKIKEAIEDCLAGKKVEAPKKSISMGMGMMGAM
ncbi:MAG: TlpA family protein disulfide reductase [Prevotella sp.]